MSDFKQTLLRNTPKRKLKKAKEDLILGYTRTGMPVFRPTHGAPDTNAPVVYYRTKDTFDAWSRGDHRDAGRILMEHSEREPDPKLAAWCARWSSVHRDLGGRRTGSKEDR